MITPEEVCLLHGIVLPTWYLVVRYNKVLHGSHMNLVVYCHLLLDGCQGYQVDEDSSNIPMMPFKCQQVSELYLDSTLHGGELDFTTSK